MQDCTESKSDIAYLCRQIELECVSMKLAPLAMPLLRSTTLLLTDMQCSILIMNN